MNDNQAHPSFLALDSLATGAPASPTVQEHVSFCIVCQQHVARVGPDAEVLPAWVRELPASVPPRRGEAPHPGRHSLSGLRSRLRALWLPALVMAPALAISLFLLKPQPHDAVRDHEAYVGVKAASPMVWAYVKRGDDTFLWDGSTTVLPGDLLRLKVDAMNHTHISAFGRDASGAWQRLWTGPAGGKGPTSLPVAWQIDSQPGDERILLVLSKEAVRSEDVNELKGKEPDPRWWLTELVLPKKPAEGSAPAVRGSDDLH